MMPYSQAGVLVCLPHRYASRSDLLEVHQRSEAYITFKKLRKELSFNYVVHGQSYLETNIGFMSRM